MMKLVCLLKNKRKYPVILFFIVFIFSALTLSASASDRWSKVEQRMIKVTGTVTSATDGVPLPGVSIIVKGTSRGTVTDVDGNYSIEVPDNAVLVFSFVGFETHEIEVRGRNVINVVLAESVEVLEEVVVTALGISREKKSLGYSVAELSGEEITRVAQENILNSLAGKVPGVNISSTGGGRFYCEYGY